MIIPFNKPHMTGKELTYIAEAHFNGMLAGDGPFTKKCHQWLEEYTVCKKALLTNSCTAALEMSALLINIQPGDEVIMPSYTFVSTANAFVLRGGIPVFVDIREDTLNLDERLIGAAISKKTRAIVPVHYAGVACDMDPIIQLARQHNLKVIEDAAQGIMATYKGKPLGSIGDIGAFSFHETKNVISGEGGALIINDSPLVSHAEIIREKGTDRSSFFRGEIDKYTWRSEGSSFLPGELVAAFLWAQLQEATSITQQRLHYWHLYHSLLAPLEAKNLLQRPSIPSYCQHNAHMYYVLLPQGADRDRILNQCKAEGVYPVFHYVPLHSSPGGLRFGKACGNLSITDNISNRLLRLPLWLGITPSEQEKVAQVLEWAISN
jgi:dTDP-4-amino-4,6-dideoxygalactose transaminase